MTTNELADKLGIRSTSIHRRVCTTGSYFGLRPQPLANGRLLWPDDAIEQLTKAQPKKAVLSATGADHAPA